MKKEIPPSNLLAQITETELAHLAQLGHVGAFSALFDLHKATVYSLCLRTTNSVPDAEQLTQDIFLHVFRNLGACPEGMNFSAWVHDATAKRLQPYERKMHLSASFVDHLVSLAAEPVGSHRAPVRFARIRARVRDARASLSNHGLRVPVWTKFARFRQTAKAIS